MGTSGMPSGRCLEQREGPYDPCMAALRTASGGRVRLGAPLVGRTHAPTRVLSVATLGHCWAGTGFRGDIVAHDARGAYGPSSPPLRHDRVPYLVDVRGRFRRGGVANLPGSEPIRHRTRGA
jgi:hypothetical protein